MNIKATVRKAGSKFLHEVHAPKYTKERRSAKVYGFAVVAKEQFESDAEWAVWSFHGTREQAEKKAATLAKGSVKWENDPMDTMVITIEQEGLE